MRLMKCHRGSMNLEGSGTIRIDVVSTNKDPQQRGTHETVLIKLTLSAVFFFFFKLMLP